MIHIPLQWYSIILLVIPGMIAAMLINFRTSKEKARDRAEKKENKAQKAERKSRKETLKQLKQELSDLTSKSKSTDGRRVFQVRAENYRINSIKNDIIRINTEIKDERFFARLERIKNFFRFFGQLITSILVYALIVAVATLIYSYFRSKETAVDSIVIWRNYLQFYVIDNWIEWIAIPGIATMLVKGITRKGWKVTVSILLVIALATASYYTKVIPTAVYPMADEILSELRASTFPFETEIQDVEHFRWMVSEGYVEKEESIDNSNGETEPPAEIDLDIDSLNLHQLLICIYYWRWVEEERSYPYIDRAYDLCQTTTQDNRYDVAEMWYYHAWRYNHDEYINAANEFISIQNYWQAAGSLWQYYDESADANRYFDLFLDCVIRGLEEDTNGLVYVDAYYSKMYSHYILDEHTDDLDLICAAAPDDVFLNVLAILQRIDRASDTDKEKVEQYLAKADFASCPKILLISQYFGNERLDAVYNLFVTHPEYFEVEDRINLAWLFYDKGDFKVAYAITRDTPEDVLIRSEAYIQDETAFSNNDLSSLYTEVQEVLHEYGDDLSDQYYSRLMLVKVILEGKLGFEPDYAGLSKSCREVFDSGSTTGRFIIASLEKEDENYEGASILCDELINDLSPSDSLYHRVLFLKTDILIGLASENTENAQGYYDEAVTILEALRENVESDYVSCLERLHELYGFLGRDSDKARIETLLISINGAQGGGV